MTLTSVEFSPTNWEYMQEDLEQDAVDIWNC